MIPDWWPKRLGGKASYALSWSVTLLIGLTAHQFDLFKMRERWKSRDGADEVDWERKSESDPRSCVDIYRIGWQLTLVAFWVALSFFAMLLPAIACFSKLKRDKRHTYRHAAPAIPNKSVSCRISRLSCDLADETSLSQPFSKRIPASWRRFLWFMTSLGLASFALLAGQGKLQRTSHRSEKLTW